MINNLKEIISHSMAFIEDDFTELWVVVNKIYEENPELSFSELIEATKIVLKELIEGYNVKLLDEETQQPTDFDSSVIINIVEKRLKELNQLPTIGDGIWFTM
ncbi:MAG: hypothetical protein A2275_05645 [Bacteroidetes bacterium RIFOXYA12_FULL_35_11]|nr:MAG: hypothetical protein A2X01_10805 [Bacteroidetes bacterium GWF2_35_48]OFY74965.1 MAG: hypothetical protein A2275_05645 [Bacteroidetes bacterium RIFOXYA12_FULL_35_11]OFY96941.1 MAG: hypothetical protein A2309_09585 [Bacteroidetes bacterium RIFOXYB2_FULL_35_7]OFY97292.1 MAG: hypothetical protein A2491_07735 [Bacteroidetes bacterium RIFOXYC12_FULL_35_7]HBX53201.1 hypothetical protein [Bacteroidales bacterium]